MFGLIQFLETTTVSRSPSPTKRAKTTHIGEEWDRLSTGISFETASLYLKIAQFVIDYPRFMLQSEFVTPEDWTGHINHLRDIVSRDETWKMTARDCFSLHVHGFQVFRGLLTDILTPNVLEILFRLARTQPSPGLFNSAPYESDQLRTMLTFSDTDIPLEDRKLLTVVQRKLANKLQTIAPHLRAQSASLLVSLPGCPPQLVHADYSADNLGSLADDRMPLSALIALQPGTFFDAWPGAIRYNEIDSFFHTSIEMSVGDVTLFRPDLAHGGASFEQFNCRIHMYLEPKVGFKRTKLRDENGEETEQVQFMHDFPNIHPRNSH